MEHCLIEYVGRKSGREKKQNPKYYNENFINNTTTPDNTVEKSTSSNMSSEDEENIAVDIPQDEGELEEEIKKLEAEVSKKKEQIEAAEAKAAKRNYLIELRRDANRLEKETEMKKNPPVRAEKSDQGIEPQGDSRKDTGGKRTSKNNQNGVVKMNLIRKQTKQHGKLRSEVASRMQMVQEMFDTESEGESDVEAPKGKSIIQGRNHKNGKNMEGPIFPNEVLGPQHALKQGKRTVDYHELDLRLLCLGEAIICSSGQLSAEETQGRMFWLANILTYAKSYKFSAILTLHEEMIVQVHLGNKTWYSDHAALVAQIVIPHPLVTDERKPKWDKGVDKKFIYFCGEFNSEEGCTEPDRHKMLFKGETVTAHHICASCLIRDKKQRPHAEGEDGCPYRE